MRFGCSNWKGNSMHASLCRLVLSSSIYNIWSFRNEIKHNGHPKNRRTALEGDFLGSEVHNSKKREVSKVSEPMLSSVRLRTLIPTQLLV
jgi:type II secretory pathway component PulC